MKIYLDKNPNIDAFEQYKKNLKDYFDCEIIETSGLADGYVRSIKESSADYLFQLEHDWQFLPGINHELKQILETMARAGIYHFRFSKHKNKIVPELMKWQTVMVEKEVVGIKYCETDNLSNNPHIIDRTFYLENLINKISVLPGSRGIEGNLTKVGLIGCQYGGLGYPATIRHLQGRKRI